MRPERTFKSKGFRPWECSKQKGPLFSQRAFVFRGQLKLSENLSVLRSFEVRRRHFAGALVFGFFERDLLAFVEAAEASGFDGAHVYEHVIAAVVRLDKAVALGAVEPLHGSSRHVIFLVINDVRASAVRQKSIEVLVDVVSVPVGQRPSRRP